MGKVEDLGLEKFGGPPQERQEGAIPSTRRPPLLPEFAVTQRTSFSLLTFRFSAAGDGSQQSANNGAFDITAIALARFRCGFRFATAIRSKRAADVHFGFELALLIAANVTTVAFMRFD
jgi:hypothetical protein